MNNLRLSQHLIASTSNKRNGAENLYFQLSIFINKPWVPEVPKTKTSVLDRIVEKIIEKPGIITREICDLFCIKDGTLKSYHPKLREAGCTIVRAGVKGMRFYPPGSNEDE